MSQNNLGLRAQPIDGKGSIPDWMKDHVETDVAPRTGWVRTAQDLGAKTFVDTVEMWWTEEDDKDITIDRAQGEPSELTIVEYNGNPHVGINQTPIALKPLPVIPSEPWYKK